MRTILLCMSLLFTSSALAQTGSTSWGPWKFDWAVSGGSGLALRNVRFHDRTVLAEASLPAIRVQYAGNVCGPYLDLITWDTLEPISNCGGKLCQHTFTSGGKNWLQLMVLAHIGEYDLSQAWFLSDQGDIQPRLSSRGLECPYDHDHHVYWRFDFDVDGALSDQIFVFRSGVPDLEGYGPGWSKYKYEHNDHKNPSHNLHWYVRDSVTGRGLWLYPGSHDGTSNFFSNKDVGLRRWKLGESNWVFGPWGHLGFHQGESVEEKDVVFWYVAHLHHEVEEGAHEFHTAGPHIRLNY